MPTIQQIMNRARSLRNETAINSISPERAGGIMYDTLAYINEMQLLGANPLLLSKIYDSVAEMEADPAPVSDLDGSALLPGQLVCIVTGDPDDPEDGLVYRYDGTEDDTSSWTAVGKIGSNPYLEGYQYMGKAVLTPTPTDPGVPTQKVFYQATEPGTYSNFAGIVVADGEVVNFKWDGTAWSKEPTEIATRGVIDAPQKEIYQISKDMFADDVVDTDTYTLIGQSYMSDTGNTIYETSADSYLYYVAIEAGKLYRITSTIDWYSGYSAVGFSKTLPAIGSTYVPLRRSDDPGSFVYAAQENGYLILLKRLGVYVTLQEEIINVAEIQEFVNEVGPQVVEMRAQLTEYIKVPQQSLTFLADAYLAKMTKKILETQYAKVYYFPVVAGAIYKVSSELSWHDYVAVGFGVNTPVINGTFDEILLSSSAPTLAPVSFVAPANGYILLMYHDTEKSYVYDAHPIPLQQLAAASLPLGNRTIAILGDSIMQFMGGGVPTNTITLRNYDDPDDPTIYQTSEATIVNGLLYLTSSLSQGEVTEQSIRLEVVNSAQAEMDSRGWDYIKTKLGASEIINCGQGGARVTEMGVVTPYPCVNGTDALLSGKLVSLPNQARMLRRLVDSGERVTPDAIVIWLGVNGTTNYMTDTMDQAMAIPWETLADDSLGYYARRKFFGAMRYTIESLYRAFPDALIVIVSPVMTDRGNLQIEADDPAYRGFDDLERVSESLRSIANRYACPFFDALTSIGIANFAYRADSVNSTGNEIATGVPLGNLLPRYTADGLHPNDAGKIVWGNYLCRMLESNYFDKHN